MPDPGKADVNDLADMSHAAPGGNDEPQHEEGEEILQRSAFPWVTKEDEIMGHSEGDHLDTTTAQEVAFNYGVPEIAFEEFLAKEIHEAESCYGLPFTLLLVISYAGMMVSHHGTVTVQSVETALINQIEEQARFAFSGKYVGFKNMYGVNSFADFYSWMQQGLIPLIFEEVYKPWESSEGFNESFYLYLDRYRTGLVDTALTGLNRTGLDDDALANLLEENTKKFTEAYGDDVPQWASTTTPPPGVFPGDHGILSFYNKIFGGIRLVQERIQEEDCYSDSTLLTAYGRSCYGGALYELDPDPFDGRRTVFAEEDPESSRIQYLWQHDNATTTQNILSQMEKENWLDPMTQKVEIAFASYNGEHNLHTYITINFYFSRSGTIWKRIIPTSVFAEQYPTDEPWYFVFDIAWMACLAMIMYSETREAYQISRRTGCGWALIKAYISFWNMMDWFAVIYGGVIIILGAHCAMRIGDLNEVLQDIPQFSRPYWRLPGDVAGYRIKMINAAWKLEYIAFFMNRVRVLFACYPLIITLRLLKAFSAQPRLALVTRTLFNAGQNLIHFFVVFISIYSSFVMCAMSLFGRDMDEFATVARATISTFRCAMGDFDWEKMKEVGGWEASIFLFMYISIVLFMFLTILLAIIMSAYYEVHEELCGTDTLFAEIDQAYERWIGVRRGDMVPLLDCASQVKSNRRHLRILYEEDLEAGKTADSKLQPLLNKDGQLRLVTVEFLRTYVLKMRTQQSRDLLESAVEYYRSKTMRKEHADQMRQINAEMNDDCKHLEKMLDEGADGSSDSEDESPHRNVLGAAAIARQRDGDIARRKFFHRDMETCHVDLRHAGLWVGEKSRYIDEGVVAGGDSAVGSDEVQSEIDELELSLEQLHERNLSIAADVAQLQVDYQEAQQSTAAALEEIAELEPLLLQVSGEVFEVGSSFHHLRHRVAGLIEERHRIHDATKIGQKEVESAAMSRTECFELVHSLHMENEALRHQLKRLGEDRTASIEYQDFNRSSLVQARKRLEPKLEIARTYAPRAAEERAKYCEQLLLHTEVLAEFADLPEAIKILDAAFEMHEAAQKAYKISADMEAHLGNPNKKRTRVHSGDIDEAIPDDDESDEDNDNTEEDAVIPSARGSVLYSDDYRKLLVENGNTICAF